MPEENNVEINERIESDALNELKNIEAIYKNQNQRFWSNTVMVFSAGVLVGVLLVKHLKG